MKIWRKVKKEELGEPFLVWRHRATNRFFLKIGSWILGGFVFAILAAIVISIFRHPPQYIEDQVPWIVFFLVFIFGMLNAFIRNIYNGLEFRINGNGIVTVKPQHGFELLGFDKKDGLRPFGEVYELLPWSEIKELKEQDDTIIMNFKIDANPLPLMVTPVVSYFEPNGKINLAHGGALKLFSRDLQVDKDAMRTVLQKAREAKRNYHPA